MLALMSAREWVLRKLLKDERGQGAVEYVLIILGVALFLIFAAMGLRDALGDAVADIESWIGLAGPPASPP